MGFRGWLKKSFPKLAGQELWSGIHVDCSANPRNICPAVDRIISTIEARVAKLEADQTLVVLMGEDHAQPFDVLLQYLVIARLLARRSKDDKRLNIGIERTRHIRKKAGFDTKIKEEKNRKGFRTKVTVIDDTHGEISLMGDLSFTPVSAPFTHLLKTHLLFTNVRDKLSVSYNDLPTVMENPQKIYGSTFLDEKDAYTLKLIKEFSDASRPISARESLGMHIRNSAIVRKIKKHIEKSPGRIYIQICGARHVLGGTGTHCPYEESLGALLLDEKIDVLSIVPNPDQIPLNAKQFLSEKGIIITGGDFSTFTVVDDVLQEISFVEDISRNSNNEIIIPADLIEYAKDMIMSVKAGIDTSLP